MVANKVDIKLIKNAAGFKILNISGESGDVLDKHKVNYNAVLLMKTGHAIYKEANRKVVLAPGDSCDIPPDTLHKVTCSTKANFFVIMPDQAKMRFESE